MSTNEQTLENNLIDSYFLLLDILDEHFPEILKAENENLLVEGWEYSPLNKQHGAAILMRIANYCERENI